MQDPGEISSAEEDAEESRTAVLGSHRIRAHAIASVGADTEPPKSQKKKKKKRKVAVSTDVAIEAPAGVEAVAPHSMSEDTQKRVLSASSVAPSSSADASASKKKNKKKRPKTRSKQKNIRKDTRPDHMKPSYRRLLPKQGSTGADTEYRK